MHILYIHQHFSTPKGSTGTRSYEFAMQLVRRGHQVTMLCGANKIGCTGLKGDFKCGLRKGNIVNNFCVIEINIPYSNSDRFWLRAYKFINFAVRSIIIALTLQYDMLFATSTPLTVGIPCIFVKLLRRKPIIFEVRDLWPELPKAMGVIRNPIVLKAMDILESWSYKCADFCIGLSPGICAGIAKKGIDKSKISMISNGCDLHLYGKKNPVSKIRLDFQPDDFIAIYTGAHGIANGLEVVIDAAMLLQQRGSTNIKICLVGDGMQKQVLQARAQGYKLENCFFYDPVSKVTIAGMLHDADIGLMVLRDIPAFYYGTSPNKFFDYLASGLPVLNNYPGWIADLLNEHKCGLICDAGDAAALADALEHFENNKTLPANMGKRALSLATTNFNRYDLAQQFVALCEGVYDKKTV